MELDPDLDVDHQSVLAGGTIEYIPQTEAVAQATQVPLSREELASRDKERMTPGERALADIESQKYEEAERAAIDEAEKMGMKATVVETPPEGDENVPWAAGQFMRPTPDGGVEINRPAFRSWVRNTLSRLPLETCSSLRVKGSPVIRASSSTTCETVVLELFPVEKP